MKRFIESVSAILLCGMLMTPTIEARGRNNSGSQTHARTESSRSNDKKSTDRGSNKNNNDRGRNQGKTSDNQSKPTGNQSKPTGNQDNNRQSGNQSKPNNNRPGGNQGRPDNNNRPSGNQGKPNNNRPGGNQGHHSTPKPEQKPNHGGSSPRHHSKYYNPAPSRPHMPAHHVYHRPTPPPPGARYYGGSLFSTILGVTLGTALESTLDYFIDYGYNVSGYGDNIVYLTDAPMMGYNWPNATLYYTNDILTGSEFVYSTSSNNMTRFNSLYNSLMSLYGSPVSVDNDSNSMSSTWWGGDQYITLNYYPDYANNGNLRYYTSLCLGN